MTVSARFNVRVLRCFPAIAPPGVVVRVDPGDTSPMDRGWHANDTRWTWMEVRRFLPLAVGVTMLVVLAGCDSKPKNAFLGVWANDREQITIKPRGFGSRQMQTPGGDRMFTWKLSSADRIVLEFGHSAATRSMLYGQLKPDDTLLVTENRTEMTLKRVAPITD